MIEMNSAEVQSEFTKDFTKTMDAMGIVDSNVRLTGSFGIHLREKRYILENTILHSCATSPIATKSTKGYIPKAETPYPSGGSPRLLGYKSLASLHTGTIIGEVSDAIRRKIPDEGMDPSRYWDEKLWKEFIECRCDEKH